MARKKKIPVLLTARFCGRCDNDHKSSKEFEKSIIKMSFAERKKCPELQDWRYYYE